MADKDQKKIFEKLSDDEKKAALACEALYQKEEGKEWHITGIMSKDKTDNGFKFEFQLCKGEACSLQEMTADLKDGKYVAALVEDDDLPF
ncbi:hypothetical protein AAMO2058_000979800 [Amorphochlora amoebiformis]|mmetsp:Transcript_4701/g.7156  ORF Transcript_4701/g.7156 Transcript_4701/m.7156 type:complete len:90 (-) Transcript_4701:160-429(-)